MSTASIVAVAAKRYDGTANQVAADPEIHSRSPDPLNPGLSKGWYVCVAQVARTVREVGRQADFGHFIADDGLQQRVDPLPISTR
jgi:hypothetical protein